MARSENRYADRGIGRLLAVIVLGVTFMPSALGQTVSDPTRPPPAWIAAQGGVAAPMAASSEDAAGGLRVLIVGQKRRYAIVDGQVVKPGDTLNGLKVVAVTHDAIVTRGEGEAQAMKLAPDVEKKWVRASRRDRK